MESKNKSIKIKLKRNASTVGDNLAPKIAKHGSGGNSMAINQQYSNNRQQADSKPRQNVEKQSENSVIKVSF